MIEVYLAIIGSVGVLIAGLMYALRKWSDVKERDHKFEREMDAKKFERECVIEKSREDREVSRAERDLRTVEYIGSSTDTLKHVCENLEQQNLILVHMGETIDRELGNGLTGLMRQQMESTEELMEMTRGMRDDIERIESSVGVSDAHSPS